VTRARDLAVTYPSLPTDAPAADVARILAEEPVDAVFIEHDGQLQGVVTDLGLLRRLLGGITTSRLITRLLGAPQ
jgi:CBS domain-containing protein